MIYIIQYNLYLKMQFSETYNSLTTGEIHRIPSFCLSFVEASRRQDGRIESERGSQHPGLKPGKSSLLPSLKLTFLPLRMDGWKTILSFEGRGYLSGVMFILGRVTYCNLENVSIVDVSWCFSKGEFELKFDEVFFLNVRGNLEMFFL